MSTSAPVPGTLSVRRIPRGLVSVIEISGGTTSGTTESAPLRLPADHAKFNVTSGVRRSPLPGWTSSEANHETYYVTDVQNTQIEFHEKVKALTVANAKGAKIAILGGCVTQIQLHKCRETIVRIDEAIGSIKLDDCNGVNIHFSHTAAKGYRDDGYEGGDRYVGIQLFHTGCHAIEVHAPATDAADSAIVSQILPEMFRTHLPGPAASLDTVVVDSSNPWGQTHAQAFTRAQVEQARRRTAGPDIEAGPAEQQEADPGPVF